MFLVARKEEEALEGSDGSLIHCACGADYRAKGGEVSYERRDGRTKKRKRKRRRQGGGDRTKEDLWREKRRGVSS